MTNAAMPEQRVRDDVERDEQAVVPPHHRSVLAVGTLQTETTSAHELSRSAAIGRELRAASTAA